MCHICDNENGYSSFQNKMRENIDRTGLGIISVCGGAHGIPHAYSIGLTESEQNMPEILLSGAMSQNTHMMLINYLHAYWKEHGVQYGVLTELFNHPCEIVRLDINDSKVRQDCTQLFEFYKSMPCVEPKEIVQLIWADTKGNLATSEQFEMPYSIELHKRAVTTSA